MKNITSIKDSLSALVFKGFVNNLLCFVLFLHHRMPILKLALLSFGYLFVLPLPLILGLGVDFLSVLSGELEVRYLYKLFAKGEHLALKVSVGLLSLLHVGLYQPEVVLHARLAGVNSLNHQRCFLSHSLHHTL
jgi:hypothetical protein